MTTTEADAMTPVPPQLPPGQQLAAPGKWPSVGERLPPAGVGRWRVRLAGEVETPLDLSLDELRGLPRVEQVVDIHCVTRWSKLGARFGGVRLADVLALARPSPEARFVSFVAKSERDHSTSLPLADAVSLGTLLALDYEGQPLEELHGGPVRVVVPARYFYKSLKWLVRIELLPRDRLGYWEAAAGYHNTADPWQEQRYIASGLSKRDAAELLADRDFSGWDLMGIDCGGHDLAGLLAVRSLLRNADFRGCDLRKAVFDGANLTNAHFERADLRGASFRGAGLEGANFTAADLRGADLSGVSLTAATFCAETADETSKLPGAVIDASTRLDTAACADLTPLQQEYVLRQLG